MATLKGGLVARKARAGEEVLALNGKTYRLDDSMTVIADSETVHDIGGIIGGEHSGAQAGTTQVLIACAYFSPDAIARTGQKHALTSDRSEERSVGKECVSTLSSRSSPHPSNKHNHNHT